jgi:hypothetical protein
MRQVWRGRPWMAIPQVVVSDNGGLLVTYLPEGAPFGFADGEFPGGMHPWAQRGRWEGHGALMLRRPSDRYSVWAFWRGDERRFWGWYVNLEEQYRRSVIGFDTLDHELDLWSEDGETWLLKDEDAIAERVAEGRFDVQEAERVRADAVAFQAEYARHGPWWDPAWADWTPPRDLEIPSLPPGWELVPAA